MWLYVNWSGIKLRHSLDLVCVHECVRAFHSASLCGGA